ncbi:MAG TPA: O-antigen ligase family protein, partial [Dissulfurispiraceae bacterium]|nr:O-antigen ligase family protein [Dissulfurispiraceae bacterium]
MRSKLIWIYLAILIFSPVAFGSVEQWSLTIMEGLSLFALLLLLLTIRKDEKNKTAPLYKVPGIIPLFCLWTYFIVQMVPLPAAVVNVLSPETYRTYAETIGVFGPVSWISLSLQKKATLVEFLRVSGCAAFYILTVQLLSRKRNLKRTVSAIIAFTGFLALSSILQHLTSPHRIFWFREIELGVPFGPFVNRNHYAGLMGMLFPVVLSMFLTLRPKMHYASLREKLTELFGHRHANTYILVGLSAILAGISVLLSLSRGGIVCLALSTALLGGMLLLKTGKRGGIWVVVFVSVVVAVSVGWAGWETVSARFDELKTGMTYNRVFSVDKPDRPEMWGNSILIIRDFLLTGSGFGSFIATYTKYRRLDSIWTVDHAHNDYLELLADGGIIAFALSAWFLLEVLLKSYRVFIKRRDSYSIYLYIGCIAGIFSILFHSLVDFNLHIASNSLYFFFLCGLAVSAANTRLHESQSPSYLKVLPGTRMSLWRIMASAALVFCVVVNIGILAGESYFSQIRDKKMSGRIQPADLAFSSAVASKASMFDPLEARYHYAAAAIEERSSDQAALVALKRAVTLDPLNSEYLQRLGLLLSQTGDTEKGNRLIRAGVDLDASNPARYKLYALFLISKGKKEEAFTYIRKALAMSPDRSDDFIMLMMLRGVSDEDILSTLPPRVAAYLAFGDYLYLSGKNEAAEKAFRDALYYASREKNTSKAHFDKLYRYYIKKERFEDALNVVKLAAAAFPNAWDLYFEAGDL